MSHAHTQNVEANQGSLLTGLDTPSQRVILWLISCRPQDSKTDQHQPIVIGILSAWLSGNGRENQLPMAQDPLYYCYLLSNFFRKCVFRMKNH